MSASEDKLQAVLGGELFSSTPAVDGLKQILEFMEPHAQPLSIQQLQAIAYLNWLGMRELHREYREQHKGQHPYTALIKWICDSAVMHADPGVFLRTIEAVIPPTQHVVYQGGAGQAQDTRRRRR
ncbi:MAG: hypothetical protein K6T57_15680 [Thermaceae bacterium]|nr:hypothetical protein [Thermaceae bacterium]